MKKIFCRSFSAVNKRYKDSLSALSDVKNGSSFLLPGFGIVGIPENSLRALYTLGVKDIKMYTNSVGLNDLGHGPLIMSGQVSQVNTSFLGHSSILEKLFLQGKAEVNMIPQGTLVERMRCSKAGLAGFYTRTSFGTWISQGKFPSKLKENGEPEKFCASKETREFDGKDYVFEEAFNADYSLIKGHIGDKYGNIRFRKVGRNFNPDVAGAAKITIAEVENFVDRLEPDQIHLPGVFVDRIYQGELFHRKLERLEVKQSFSDEVATELSEDEKRAMKVAKRLSKEYKDGMYINLGVGIPSDTAKFLPPGADVTLQAENGIIGAGDPPGLNGIDPDLVDAGLKATTVKKGHSYVSSSDAFGIIRGRHLHATVLGGLEVSQEGDLANFFVPGKMFKGVGGAMDLVSGCDCVMVGMLHTYKGKPRVLKKCSLPLTAIKCVKKLVTDMAVFEFFYKKEGIVMELLEIAEGMTVEELRKVTPAEFTVSKNLRKYQA